MSLSTSSKSCVHASTQGQRLCKLPSCGKTFTPKKPWQKFCPAPSECHDIYWRIMRPSDQQLDAFLRERIGQQWLDEFWAWRQEH